MKSLTSLCWKGILVACVHSCACVWRSLFGSWLPSKIASVRFGCIKRNLLKLSSHLIEISHTGEVECVDRRAHCEAEGSLRVQSELALNISTADWGGQRAGALRKRMMMMRCSESKKKPENQINLRWRFSSPEIHIHATAGHLWSTSLRPLSGPEVGSLVSAPS